MRTIDINCDLGEGGKEDEQLMSLISSCNIACAGHYGDVQTMTKTIQIAKKNKVAIGAHPAYPDKKNFGRTSMKLSLSDLKATLMQQITAFMEIAQKQNIKVHHVKAHGSLYHDIKHHPKIAKIYATVIETINPELILYIPPQSAIEKDTEGKLKTWTEGFGDRKYTSDYELVSRHEKGAVLIQKEQVLNQILSIVKDGRIPTDEKNSLPCKVQTICLHSDTPDCVGLLQYINQQLPLHGFKIALP